MSKISTKRLSRGIRLKAGHVLGQLQTALGQFTTPSIDTNNLSNSLGTFRLNFHVPVLKGIAPSYELDHLPIWIPFVLPPTQEFFTLPTLGEFPTLSPDYPRPVLQEISISFDQRAEAAAISAFDTQTIGATHPNAWEGQLNYEATNRLDIDIALYEKEMLVWTADSPLIPEDRLLTFSVPAIAYMDTRSRLNPTSKTGINQAIDPNKSYLLEVSVPKLTDETLPAIQLNSILVSLKFEQRLLQRDINKTGVDVQNMPTSNNGAIVPPTSVIALPTKTPERVMAVADVTSTGTGTQTAFETIDKLYRKLLRGGYNDRGDTVTGQTVATDAGYEVIAVPLFGNGIELHSSWNAALDNPGALRPKDMPWAPLTSNFTYDMRRIPIRYPFVIHHVVAALNWTPGIKDYEYTTPVEPNFNQIIGVGIGTGIRSDDYGFRQVALAEWRGDLAVPPLKTKFGYRLDRYNENLGNPQKNIGFDLMQVPLVGSGGVTYPLQGQGKPFYVGKTPSENALRSTAASGSLLGQEQWLEVRWKLEDPVNQMSGGAWKTTDTIIGRGGHWVFIIGKKHLA